MTVNALVYPGSEQSPIQFVSGAYFGDSGHYVSISGDGEMVFDGPGVFSEIIGGSEANDTLKLNGTSSSTNATSAVILQDDGGQVAVGVATAEAELHVKQQSATAAIPVLLVDQVDVSEEFIHFRGKSAADNTQSIVDASDLATPGAIVGWLKIYVEDTAASGAVTDGVYFIPFYATPTAGG